MNTNTELKIEVLPTGRIFYHGYEQGGAREMLIHALAEQILYDRWRFSPQSSDLLPPEADQARAELLQKLEAFNQDTWDAAQRDHDDVMEEERLHRSNDEKGM